MKVTIYQQQIEVDCSLFIISVNCHNKSAGQYKYPYFTNEETKGWSFHNLSVVIELTRKLRVDGRTAGSVTGPFLSAVWPLILCHSFTESQKSGI